MSRLRSTIAGMGTTLSGAEARRIALAAHGFTRSRPDDVTGRHLRGGLDRLQTLQIDSVNVFARAHYMPLFSRLGGYDTPALDRLLFRRGAPYVEYRAHEAAFIPRTDWGLFSFRMQYLRGRYGGAGSFVSRHADIVSWVRDELAVRGPLRPSQFDHELRRRAKGPWWDWDEIKTTLEYLWLFGDVAIAGRRGFERTYALAEHTLTAAERDPVSAPDAIRELVRRAARSYGVATAADIDDFWRFRDRRAVLTAVGDLVDSGELEPVRVDGWERAGRPVPAWRHRDAACPRRVDATAILSPFDPVVWFRDRALRMFGLDYRIEIYVPAHKRRFGYYSLPVLMDDAIVGRVDLKTDRARQTLLVQSAWWEPRVRPADAADRLASQLRAAAAWQGLDTISVGRWGDAADQVASSLGAARHDRG